MPLSIHTDPRGRLKLILTFTDTDADAPNAPTDPVEDTERRHQELKAKILAARPKVQDKKVILEKLGKARGLIGYIDTVGHAIGEVRTTWIPDCVPSYTHRNKGTSRCRRCVLCCWPVHQGAAVAKRAIRVLTFSGRLARIKSALVRRLWT